MKDTLEGEAQVLSSCLKWTKLWTPSILCLKSASSCSELEPLRTCSILAHCTAIILLTCFVIFWLNYKIYAWCENDALCYIWVKCCNFGVCDSCWPPLVPVFLSQCYCPGVVTCGWWDADILLFLYGGSSDPPALCIWNNRHPWDTCIWTCCFDIGRINKKWLHRSI